jgi:hypothetical protein
MDERSMSEGDYEAVLDGFIADLKRAWHAAGTPSYSQMEQASVRLRACPGPVKLGVLARSTTQEILSRRRTQPPRWQWVVSFVTVLQAVARDGAVPVDSIGAIDAWKRRHDAVRAAAEMAAKRPVSVGGRHRKQAGDDTTGLPSSARHVIPPQLRATQHPAGPGKAVLHAHGEILQFLRQAPGLRWWHSYHDVAPEWLEFFLSLESAAKIVRTYEPRLIPGLLQVDTYARAVLEQCRPDASANEITRLVELRMRRQELLREQDSFQLWAIVDEAALRTAQADTQTMRSQITHLINISGQPNVTIQVLRSPGLDDHVAIKEPITIFRFPEEHLDDVILLEQPDGYVFLSDRTEAEHYSQLMSRLAMRAAAADDARSLLNKIFTEL